MTKRIILLQGLAATPEQIAARMATIAVNQSGVRQLLGLMAACEEATLRLLKGLSKEKDSPDGTWELTAKDRTPELTQFSRLRQQTLALLKKMNQSDWQGTVVHPFLGASTLQKVVHKQLEHDLLLINKMADCVQKDAVAPAPQSEIKGRS